jgi:hypothetical protein
VATGETTDISHIRFHFYKPVWYLNPTAKAGETRYLKGNFIGFSDTVGDNFSYEIAVKKTRSRKSKTLSRTVVLPRDLQDSAFPGQSNPSTIFPHLVVPSAGRNRTIASECDTGSGTKRALETGTRQQSQGKEGHQKSHRNKSNQKPTVQQDMEVLNYSHSRNPRARPHGRTDAPKRPESHPTKECARARVRCLNTEQNYYYCPIALVMS